MADNQAKYQKLAAEYAKLKAQLPVLKQAVRDEQMKETQFKETIKEKDQSIRKYEQEIDSLVFRNQQLSKRVEILQGELAELESKLKKHKHKNHDVAMSTSPRSSVMGEELQNKIHENEMLHKQVHDSDLEHKQKVMDLEDRLSVLERESSQHQQVLQQTQQSNKATIEKLQGEKAVLEIQLQNQEQGVKEAKLKAEAAEQQLKLLQSQIGTQLAEATKTIKDKLPFNDTKHRELNALNVPTHDRKHQLKAKELMGQANNLVKELVMGLSNFHTYIEQRSRVYPIHEKNEPLSPTNRQFCDYLHENMKHLRPVEESFMSFCDSLKDDALLTLETAGGLQEFALCFKRYVAYANKLLPYHLLSIEEECSVSSCPSNLQDKNMELHGSLQKFMSVFMKLETYVNLIAIQSTKNCDHPRANQPKIFECLSCSLDSLQLVLKEVTNTYNSKVSLEHQLPTAPQQLKTTDECVIKALVSLGNCAGKFANFTKTNLDFFCATAGYRTRGSSISTNESVEGPKSNPVVSAFRHKAANYLASLNRPPPESVPYKVAIDNRRTLLSSTESRDSLSKQVSNFQVKTSRLEQEKEHWMLESQLLQIKYEKEMKRVQELERRLHQLESSSTGTIDDNLTRDEKDTTSTVRGRPDERLAEPEDTSMLGSMTSIALDGTDTQTREELIKNHFTQRISELTTSLQVADSKAVNFHAECRALHKRLDVSDKAKEKAQEELRLTNQNLTQLRDELQMTTKSYENQLSMMSEHLAGMNEKIIEQKDEIDDLRHKLNIKGGKKGKK